MTKYKRTGKVSTGQKKIDQMQSRKYAKTRGRCVNDSNLFEGFYSTNSTQKLSLQRTCCWCARSSTNEKLHSNFLNEVTRRLMWRRKFDYKLFSSPLGLSFLLKEDSVSVLYLKSTIYFLNVNWFVHCQCKHMRSRDRDIHTRQMRTGHNQEGQGRARMQRAEQDRTVYCVIDQDRT